MKPTNEVNSNVAPFSENGATQTQQSPPVKKAGRGNILRKILSGDFLIGDGLIKHLSFVLFLVFLFIANIGLVYYFENTAREKKIEEIEKRKAKKSKIEQEKEE